MHVENFSVAEWRGAAAHGVQPQLPARGWCSRWSSQGIASPPHSNYLFLVLLPKCFHKRLVLSFFPCLGPFFSLTVSFWCFTSLFVSPYSLCLCPFFSQTVPKWYPLALNCSYLQYRYITSLQRFPSVNFMCTSQCFFNSTYLIWYTEFLHCYATNYAFSRFSLISL